jgi:non-specific serine/threonine protein kinase/serine/threonine-protein kinase
MTTPEQWPKIKEIVGAALEIEPSQRSAFLDQACAKHGELRAEIESLLAAEADAALSEAPWGTTLTDPVGETKTIGRYRLIRELGVGGMGRVWLAEQTEPVRRRIALKLIKAGMYDAVAVQRFQSERQSLAIMEHPAIAKVFDAGTTPEGQPYLAMEYVNGVPITEYCDRKKLSIRERLRLFMQVCEGVQHAHQKAIIHRDLKPSNILVAEIDGKPTPRIIDFGLAKGTMQYALGESLHTQIGAFLGTPGYMSPEQADPQVLDVDTRTDVYSLGVVLYELLTGYLPFDTRLWKQHRLDEVLRQLRETEPQSPSTKVSTNRETASNRAEARRTEAKQLATLLRGDLDWMVMKALEKDRDRRYGTASELAADIERYLENKPIVARPASRIYRLRKYVRRHQAGVAVAASTFVVLVAFAATQAAQLRRITRERDRADRITEFMATMFQVSDPGEARGNSITAREILDRSAREIDQGLANDPQVQGPLMCTMARTYEGLGLYPRAQTLYERAVETEQRALGSDDPKTLNCMRLLAWDLRQQGHLQDAENLLRKTLRSQQRALGGRHRDTLASMNALGWTLSQEGHYGEAEQLLKQTLEDDRAIIGAEDKETLSVMHHLASTFAQEGHLADAEKMKRELLDIEKRVLGPENPLVLTTTNNLASTLHEEGRYDEADAMYRNLFEMQQRILGPEHPDTIWTIRNLGVNYESQGKLGDAEKNYRQALELMKRTTGKENPDTLSTTSDLGILLREEGQNEASEKILREALEVQRRVLGPENPTTLDTAANLGATLKAEGHYGEAAKLLRETLEADLRVLGPTHTSTLEAMENIAELLRIDGKCSEAETLYRQSLAAQVQANNADDPGTLETLGGLAVALSCEKRYPEGEKLLRDALARVRDKSQSADVARLWYSLARAAAIAGQRKDAVDALRHCYQNGYTGLSIVLEPDLKSLRSDPDFQMLVAEQKNLVAGAPAH